MNILANMWAGFTALLDSVTEPAYLIIVGPITVVAALFVWAEHRADRIREAQETAREASLAYWAEENKTDLVREAEQRWRALAPRRRGQDLPKRNLGGVA